MARRLPYLIIFIAAVLLIAANLAIPPAARADGQSQGPPGQNDAGSGGDAGDSPEQALLIASANRRWSANLTPTGTDSDWYQLGTSSAFCALGEATLGTPGGLTLAGTPTRDATVDRTVGAHESVELALASPAGLRPYFGVEPQALLMASSGSQAQGPAHYTFSLRAFDHAALDPEGDGELPEAGATTATGAPLTHGCTAGRLSSEAADLEDHYVFDVTEARVLTLSLAIAGGDPVSARVVTPAGLTYATLASGDVADVWAAEPGRWSVVVSAPTSSSALALRLPVGALMPAHEVLDSQYLLASTDGPGDPQSCRPSCWG